MQKIIEKYGMRNLIRFLITVILYVLWTIWVGRYWLLIGLVVIVDIYITQKVNWAPWKKKSGKNHWAIEWFDALIFAVVAVTVINTFLFQNYKIPTGSMEKSLLIGDHLYVSKAAYGPRIPNTPLSLPFMQHTIPGTKSKSFVEWVHWPYERLAGFGKVERYDPVVFNFPSGDTVCYERQNVSYEYIIRETMMKLKTSNYLEHKSMSEEDYRKMARERVRDHYKVVYRPVDKRDNYIKRAIAIPGDTLVINQSKVFVNGKEQIKIPGVQHMSILVTNSGTGLNMRLKDKYGINDKDIFRIQNNIYQLPLTKEAREKLSKTKVINTVEKIIQKPEDYDPNMFPHDTNFKWNLDNYGPIYIPQKGSTVELNLQNLPLYKRIIDIYEENDVRIEGNDIYINNELATSYTFKMDYYWMMGDNRHSSLDSRYWGFVPEDHIVGKPKFIWLSLNKEKSFPANIRLRRMFKVIR